LVKIKNRDHVTPAEVRKWWRRWPTARIAILTGAWSNLVVVDLDGEDGEQALKRAEAVLGDLPPTLEAKTKHGRHLYFTHPGGKILTRKGDDFWPEGRDHDNAHGLDVRGDGGLVIVREFVNDLDPAELPEGWVGPLGTSSTPGIELGDEGVAQALVMIRTEGEPCSCMERVLDKYQGEKAAQGRYPAARNAQLALVHLGREQHPGAGVALDLLLDAFLADKPDGEHEWARALDGAVSAAMAKEPEVRGCPYRTMEIEPAAQDGEQDPRQLLDQALGEVGKKFAEQAVKKAKQKKEDEAQKRVRLILDAALDAEDLDQLPESVPLLPSYLNRSEYVLVSGKFGTYKSLVCLGWAYAVATGQGWAGADPAEPVPVVYVAAEGITGFRRRLRALERRHGVKVARGMLTVIRRPVHLTNPDEVIGLAMVVQQRQAKLVILDTWHRMTPGVEENSATETGGPLDQLLTLRDNYDATVVLVHHTGHAQRHARGSSALEDDADAAWIIRLGDGMEDEEERGPSTPRTLVQRKSKDGELADPAQLRLQVDDEQGATVDLDPVQKAIPAPGRRGRTPQRKHADEVQEMIRLLDEHDIGLDEGYRAVMDWDAHRRPGHATTQRAVREALAHRRGRATAYAKGREAWDNFGEQVDAREQKAIES
jgi:hypothetical protein